MPKTKSKRQHSENFKIGKQKPIDSLPPGASLPRGSKYNDVIDLALRLTPGNMFDIDFDPAEGEFNHQKKRLDQVVRLYIQPASRHYIQVRSTGHDWKVGIYCYEAVEIDGIKRKVKPAKETLVPAIKKRRRKKPT